MQLSATMHASEPDFRHCGLVADRKGSPLTWGSMGVGVTNHSHPSLSRKESEGPLQLFIRAAQDRLLEGI